MPWEAKNPEPVAPPCETCEIKIDPENVQVFSVYRRCADDWNTAGGIEPIRTSLSSPAIWTALNVSGVRGLKKRAHIFDRVQMIGRAIAKELMAEREKRAGKAE